MSHLYNVEPQPTGKVLLKTTSGDIVLELFAKQAPLASRNFIQHCLDGYYDGTLFHRLVPGFIIQGGDPTGLGTGGESALEGGKPFADEFHSRLRFNRRGLLGMANSGQKDDNTSQFFFTLDKTPELQGKNTMFGRVEGDTIYNVMKMADAELAEDGGDRPLYPTRVLGAEVLVNPFSDMVKRTQVEVRVSEETKKAVKKKRKPAKGVLSFADEMDDAPVAKKAKVNAEGAKSDASAPKAKPREISPPRAHRYSSSSRSSSPEPAPAPAQKAAPAAAAPPSRSPSPEPAKKPMSALERTNAEIAALKASMRRGNDSRTTKEEKPKSALESMIPATATRGRKRGGAGRGDDVKALDMLSAFRARLHGAVAKDDPSAETKSHETSDAANDEDETTCDLHFIVNCQSCRSWDKEGEANDEDDDENWMAHKLSFAKDTLGKDLEWKKRMEEFEEVDSREERKAGKTEGWRERKREEQDRQRQADGRGDRDRGPRRDRRDDRDKGYGRDRDRR